MRLNQDSITVNMVVKMVTDKYLVEPNMAKGTEETSIQKIQQMIEDGNFKAEYILSTFSNCSTGTLIITEKA